MLELEDSALGIEDSAIEECQDQLKIEILKSEDFIRGLWDGGEHFAQEGSCGKSSAW
jgi:hypothetical protein